MTNDTTILRFDQASAHYQTNSIKYRKISADNDKKCALQNFIHVAGASLEMIAIGDLMFFDDPLHYVDQYAEIGYGPRTDLPCYASELAALFDQKIFNISFHKIHPLVGVLKATKSTHRTKA